MERSFLQTLRFYGIFGTLRLARDVIWTQIFFPNSRIIRQPFYIRGRKNISFGKSFTTGVGIRLDAFSEDKKIVINIGENVQINDYVHIAAMESVKIGDNVLIASKVFISDHNHGNTQPSNVNSDPLTFPLERKEEILKVEIKERVWIGENVSILPGVTIGSGSIIGAGSVVTKNIDENTIAAGIPAKPIKKFNNATKTWEKIK